MATKFQVDEISTVRGFREYKDTKKFSLIDSLRPLIVEINTIAISSSEFERSYSTMNNTVIWKRNALTLNHIPSLLLIQCVGPPTKSFIPSSFVKSWIIKVTETLRKTAVQKGPNWKLITIPMITYGST